MHGHFLSGTRKLNRHYQSAGAPPAPFTIEHHLGDFMFSSFWGGVLVIQGGWSDWFNYNPLKTYHKIKVNITGVPEGYGIVSSHYMVNYDKFINLLSLDFFPRFIAYTSRIFAGAYEPLPNTDVFNWIWASDNKRHAIVGDYTGTALLSHGILGVDIFENWAGEMRFIIDGLTGNPTEEQISKLRTVKVVFEFYE